MLEILIPRDHITLAELMQTCRGTRYGEFVKAVVDLERELHSGWTRDMHADEEAGLLEE